jgi:hypothetical protein
MRGANHCEFSGRLAAAKGSIRCNCGRKVAIESGRVPKHSRPSLAQLRKARRALEASR